MKPRKLFFKLYPTYLFIIIFSLLAVGSFFAANSKTFFINQVIKDLQFRGRMINDDVERAVKSNSFAEFNKQCRTISEQTQTRITLISSTGEILVETNKDISAMENHKNRPEVKEALQGKVGVSIRYSRTLARNMLYVALPVYINGRLDAILRMAMSISDIDDTLYYIYKNIFWAILIISLLSVFICFYAVKRVTAPLEMLKDGAANIARGLFSARLPIPEIDEFAELAQSVNNMAEQLTHKLSEITEQNYEKNAILSSMREGVIAVDNDFKIIIFNKAAREFFGLKKSETKERLLQEVVRNTRLNEFINEVFTSGETTTMELEFDGEERRIIRINACILEDIRNKPLGVLLVFNDITQVRLLEDFRKDFIANVSHEIRTPITVINGAVEALNSGALAEPELADKFLNTLLKHSARLNDLVSDVLDLSAIEQMEKTHDLSREEVTVSSIIDTVCEMCREKAEEKDISIKVREYDHSLTLNVNFKLIEQALSNLVFNAVKYSPAGREVELIVTERKATVEIAVLDNGEGIHSSHLGRLFERFYRVDKGRSRNEGGTGLGLAIVKHIVKAHDGEVRVKSRLGYGSRFTIILPRTQME